MQNRIESRGILAVSRRTGLRQLPLLALCVLTGACSRSLGPSFTAYNPMDTARPDALLILGRGDLENKLGPIPQGNFVSIAGPDGRPLVVQLDDLNGDGRWDEAACEYSFKPHERVTFSLAITAARQDSGAVSRAHVRLRKKGPGDVFGPILTSDTMPNRNPPTDFSRQPLPLYLTEGPAWENDKVAFRLYFDTRNGKDIYGKRLPGMVMDTVGANVNNSYHKMSGWGMDILHVGNSLGAGSIAFSVPQKRGNDTLIRLGGDSIRQETYQMVADGPVRAIFRVHYVFVLGGRPIHVTDEVSIWGGFYGYQDVVTVDTVPPGTRLVTGIADFFQNWSRNFAREAAAVLYSVGPQSENHDTLGMAVLVPRAGFERFGETPKEGEKPHVVYVQPVYDSYTVAEDLTPNQPAMFRFFSAWAQTDPRFADQGYFVKFLQWEADRFSNPVQLKW